MFAKFFLAHHPHFHMLRDQIKQGALPQIPSRMALQSMLPANQTIVLLSPRDCLLLSPPLIFMVFDEIKNSDLLVIPNQRDLYHPNMETPISYVEIHTLAPFTSEFPMKLDFRRTWSSPLDGLGLVQWIA